MTATPLRLSLVLPCYNGGAFIAESLRQLFAWLDAHREMVGPFEVILADDGSRDDTAKAAHATGLPVKVVRLDRNRGKGAAVRTGMAEATGAYRIFMDSDLPFELDAIERMLHYLDFKEFDVCIGTRATRGTAYTIEGPPLRRLASKIFSEFVGRLVVTGVRDTQCGFKGFRAPVAEYLFGQSKVDSFAFDVELLYLAFKNGFDVKTLPVRLLEEKPSTVNVFNHGLPMALEVMKLPFRFHSGGYRLYGDGPAAPRP